MPTTGHATATVNGTVIADATSWEVVDGNVYFPPETVKTEFLKGPTDTHTHCPWKGDASYYTIQVHGTELKDAAWFYPSPKDAAANIRGHVAFYKSKVEVTAS
ncbi:hypothetical protein P8C59_000758 [Phyllachora maydis]|uniref:DUF427 domain-containing protein n=1 Tax=Phyllachora maydis TaxID=1825666 RepID=A0AAD9HXW5_9PEZI|nr:hypothetical protein P8C59_000758 [Phyllachora maydis]